MSSPEKVSGNKNLDFEAIKQLVVQMFLFLDRYYSVPIFRHIEAKESAAISENSFAKE
jgi:hypothetical protein